MTITDSTQNYNLGSVVDILEDKDGTTTIEQIISAEWSNKFIQSSVDIPNFGFTRSVYWVRVELDHDSPHETRWFLEVGYPLLDQIVLYSKDESGVWQQTLTGDTYPFSQRPLNFRNFVFPLNLEGGRSETLYLRIKTESSMQIPLNLWSPDKFAERINREVYGLGIYYGIMLVMILYNLFIYVSVRDIGYLFYVLFITLYALIQLALNGLAFEYLWPDFPWWANRSIPFLIALTEIPLILFTRNYLRLKDYLPRTDLFFKAMVLIHAVLTILPFVAGYSLSIKTMIYLVVVICLAMTWAGISTLTKGSREARFFVFAWGAFFLGALVYSFQKVGLIPSSFITEYGVQFGSAGGVILLSLGLADKINELKKESAQAQAHALEIQRQANERLEKKVAERTSELNLSLTQVEKAQAQLTTINDIVKIINKETDFEIILESILKTFSLLIPSAQRAFCMIMDSENKNYIIEKTLVLSANDFQTMTLGSEWNELFYTHITHYIEWAVITEYSGVVSWNLYAESSTPQSVLSVPVTLNGEIAGFFHFDNMNTPDAFHPEMFAMIGDLTEHITSAFLRSRTLKILKENEIRLEKNARSLNRALRQAQQREETIVQLNHLMKSANETLDLNNLIKALLEGALIDKYAIDGAIVHFADVETRTLEFAAFYNVSGRYEHFCNDLDQSSFFLDKPDTPFGRSSVTKNPVYLRNVPEDRQTIEGPLKDLKLRHVQSLLIYPLIIQGDVIGTISFFSADYELKLNEQHLENIQGYIDHIVTPVNNIRLYEISQQDRKLITRINQVMQTVNATLDLDEVMAAVKAALQEMFTFDAIGIQLVDEVRQYLNIYRIYGDSISEKQVKRWSSIPILIDGRDSLSLYSLHMNGPVYVPDVNDDIPLGLVDEKIRESFRFVSLLCLPLTVQNKVIGVISFYNSGHGFSLSEIQIAQIQRYVTQIAATIHNARLYDDLKSTKIQLLETEKIAEMTKSFERFVPKQFLNRIAKNGLDRIELGMAESDIMTILFCDIRSFTTLAEKMSPQELLNFLNAYLDRMSKPIHVHNGFVDKFIGDAIMALFDNPGGPPEVEAQGAVDAAIGMQETLRIYNEHRRFSGYVPLSIGIGIHTGPVVVGTVGSRDRMDSTVLGDNVNLAARLEGLTKYYGAKIIISEDTMRLLESIRQYKYRQLDWLRVKGKAEPVSIYEIYSADDDDIQRLKMKSERFLRKGLFSRFKQQWDESITSFQEVLAINPKDKAAEFHIKNCLYLKNNPPEQGWDGSISLDSK
ncbi:MAG: GAF domain-containing protein [SAR324 cluster bacterium]|nr:GAF domain-containing protein [SAR324 cluster bacterium]